MKFCDKNVEQDRGNELTHKFKQIKYPVEYYRILLTREYKLPWERIGEVETLQ